MRPRVGLYAVDQDAEKTRSKGILNYTRNLIRQMAQFPDPGFEIILLLSNDNRADLLPPERPTWLSAHVAQGRFGRGWKRLFADQMLVNVLSARLNLDLIHFPKGWLPIIIPRRPYIVATLHDAIPAYYRRVYPKVDPWRFRYFAWQTARTLQRADVVLTISHASARQLSELDTSKTSKIRVIPEGAGLPLHHLPPVPGKPREGIVVLGSLAPHKQTHTTLKLLQAWAAARSTELSISLVGLERLPANWHIPTTHLDLRLLGCISDERLIEEFQHARALVLLSEIEGFGMPALESYICGTPVCYRAIPALAQLLDDAPGGWDGDGEQTFFSALDTTLALSRPEIDQIRTKLLSTFSWARCASATIAEYQAILKLRGPKPRPSSEGEEQETR